MFGAGRDSMRQSRAMTTPDRPRRHGAVPLTALVGKIIDPVIAARGFANGDLLAAWPEIVGRAFAGWTEPERIVWPRGVAGKEPPPGILHLKVDGPRAVYVQHELPQIVERVNAYLGYFAIAQVRILQKPVARRQKPAAPTPRPLSPTDEAELSAALTDVADDRLRGALDRLGRGVLARRDKKS
jgi:hypothetical protein